MKFKFIFFLFLSQKWWLSRQHEITARGGYCASFLCDLAKGFDAPCRLGLVWRVDMSTAHESPSTAAHSHDETQDEGRRVALLRRVNGIVAHCEPKARQRSAYTGGQIMQQGTFVESHFVIACFQWA